MIKFRDLTKDEIEVRVAQYKFGKIELLLYKTARTDADILDETIGAEKWQAEFYECCGNLFCRIGIKCGDEWVWKSDCGSETNIEKEKGQASDAFKRAGFKWGIGRELYTAPRISVPETSCFCKDGKCLDKFGIEKIRIVDKKITGVSVLNGKGERVFVWAIKQKEC